MASSRSLTVQGSDAGARLDAWIARQLPELSRARAQSLMAAGAVRLGGRPARPSARLRGGEEVTVELPDPLPVSRKQHGMPDDSENAEAIALVTRDRISGWGGIDPRTGSVIEMQVNGK